ESLRKNSTSLVRSEARRILPSLPMYCFGSLLTLSMNALTTALVNTLLHDVVPQTRLSLPVEPVPSAYLWIKLTKLSEVTVSLIGPLLLDRLTLTELVALSASTKNLRLSVITPANSPFALGS